MMLFPFHSANACSLNPTAVISFPQESVFYSGVSVYTSGSGSSANCGSISGYLWKNGNTTLSTSMIFSWGINLPAGVSYSVFVLSLRVTNSHGRKHTACKTVRVTGENNSLYYLTEHLGSVRVTVDEKGNSVGWDDYYPFGLQMPGRSGNSSNPQALNKFTGYEIEEEGGHNTYHAEARGYDPLIGRFTSVDPMLHLYPNWKPYHYVLNNPVNGVDPDGRLVIFVNGFRKDGYAKNLTTSNAWKFHEGQFYHRDVFNYWREGTSQFMNRINDNDAIYVDAMAGRNSTGFYRFQRGVDDGRKLAEKIKSDEITLKGETIKLVGHSHGAAHAAGMAKALSDAGLPVELLLFLAPHQPGQFWVPFRVSNSVQLSRLGDFESSDQSKLFNLLRLFVGSSSFYRIGGVGHLGILRDGNEDNLGNHGVPYYTNWDDLKRDHPEIYRAIFGQ